MQQPDLGTTSTEARCGQGFDRRINPPRRFRSRSSRTSKRTRSTTWTVASSLQLPARDHETKYDRTAGYGFYYKPLSIGVWWDKYMALNAMITRARTSPTPTPARACCATTSTGRSCPWRDAEHRRRCCLSSLSGMRRSRRREGRLAALTATADERDAYANMSHLSG